jgi:hypothetical protein
MTNQICAYLFISTFFVFQSCEIENYQIQECEIKLLVPDSNEFRGNSIFDEIFMGMSLKFYTNDISLSKNQNICHVDSIERIDVFIEDQESKAWLTPYLSKDTNLDFFYNEPMYEVKKSNVPFGDLDNFIQLYNSNDSSLNNSILNHEEFVFWMDVRKINPELRNHSNVFIEIVFNDRIVSTTQRN